MRIDLQLPGEERTLLLGPDKSGMRITEVLRAEGIPLNTRCGEKDLCAGCTIELISGSLRGLDGRLLEKGEFRACRYLPAGNATILVPQRSLLGYEPQVVSDYRINVPYARDPLAPAGLGVAIDIGTTTVAIQVLDLGTGEVVGRAAGFNRQMHFGDDVLTRINLCSTDPTMTGRLQKAIVEETLQPLLADALCGRSDVACFSVAGNTTMLHLLVGENPSSMGLAPFTPTFLELEPFPAGQIGLAPADADVHLLPSIAAYIGADLTAGLLASGLMYDEGPALLVDVGTNGEILLKHDGEITGCATAAGPAFEGAGLTCGLRAGEGAIARIGIEADPFRVVTEQIGDRHKRPTGICGSAYVDFLAVGRRAGLLSPVGRFGERFGDFLQPAEHGRALQVARGQGSRPIVVTESDIGSLLQAKAAIAAGILTLLLRYGLEAREVRTLYLAGGFGMHLDLANAIGCGLLPGFRVEQVQLVGNTSLAGASLTLLDRNLLPELRRARELVETVELNLEPGFEDTYIEQLCLP